ncbi:MAG: class I SAM-dependent methyltransferase [Flavobacteriales bacterium]
MTEMHAGCPLCGSPQRVPSRLYAHHHLVRCARCGFRYAQRIPSVGELQRMYSDYGTVRDLSPITAKRYDELLARFAQYRSTGRILEVGCGGGLFLDRAQGAGWSTYGTEFDGAVVSEVKARGHTMHLGPLIGHPWPAEHFDVVVSIEVAEHLIHPLDDLREMVRLLRPGGALYVTTPNFNSISKWLAHGKWTIINYPEHISFFTPRTMHSALGSLGMRRKWVRTTGISLNRFRRARGKTDITTDGISNDEQLRRTIEKRPVLKFVKHAVDGLLDLTGKGDTLKVFYEKPPQ